MSQMSKLVKMSTSDLNRVCGGDDGCSGEKMCCVLSQVCDVKSHSSRLKLIFEPDPELFIGI